KAPHGRYHSARELGDDLRRFLDNRPILARPVGVGERLVKWARRRPALASLAVVLFLAVIGAAGFGIWHNAELRRERDEANRERIEALRDAAQEMIRAGKADAQAKNWEAATRRFSDAIAKTAGEPELDDLREEAQR